MSARDPIESNRVSAGSGRDIEGEEDVLPVTSGEGDPTSAMGGLGGAAIGAAAGSLAGPLGIGIGALAGGVGGWWAGRAISHAAHEYDEASFRGRHAPFADRYDYDLARPAYQLGYLAGRNPDYRERSFEDIEEHVMLGWTPLAPLHGPWPSVREYARDAFGVGQEDVARFDREVPINRGQDTVSDVASSPSLDEQLEHADEDPIAHPAEPAEAVYPTEIDALANGIPAEPGSEAAREFGITSSDDSTTDLEASSTDDDDDLTSTADRKFSSADRPDTPI